MKVTYKSDETRIKHRSSRDKTLSKISETLIFFNMIILCFKIYFNFSSMVTVEVVNIRNLT